MELRLRTAATTAQETREGVVARVPTRKWAQRHAVAAATASRTGVESRRWIDLLRRWVFSQRVRDNAFHLGLWFAWLFLALLLLSAGRAGAVTATSHLRMLPASHLSVTRAHLGVARHLIHLMRRVSGPSSPGSFAGMHFGLVSASGSHVVALISGLGLVPVCSTVTCARCLITCSLKITFGYISGFVSSPFRPGARRPVLTFCCACCISGSLSSLTGACTLAINF